MVLSEVEEGKGKEEDRRGGGGSPVPRAASSFSFAFTSSYLPPVPVSLGTVQPPSSSASFVPSTEFLFHPPRGPSSSVPQYVTTTRHTLLAGAQDNCPHYSYLKSAPRARARAATAAAASSDVAIEPRYRDAPEREFNRGRWWRRGKKMLAVARPYARFVGGGCC